MSGDLRGTAAARRAAPSSCPLGAELPLPPGVRGAWAPEPSGWRPGSLRSNRQKPLPPSLGLQSSSPPPPPLSRLRSLLSRAPPPPSSPGFSSSRWGLPGGLPGRGGAARRRGRGGERPASPALAASAERAARGSRARPRAARAEPFVPSQKLACRDRDSCGRGGRRGRRRRRRRREVGCLTCSPRRGDCGPGTGGGGGGGTHSTRDLAAGGTN